MSNPITKALGEAFSNMAGTVSEAVRQRAQNTPNPSMADHFETCIDHECRQLRFVGLDSIADGLQGLRDPVSSLLREGW